MAADILFYDTAVVPVGDDQVQHVELCGHWLSDSIRGLGKHLGDSAKLSERRCAYHGARQSGEKMSKSASSEYNYIALNDDPEMAKKKIMKAVTDSGSEILYADDKPALKNLINIYSAWTMSPEGGRETVWGKAMDFKRDLADVVARFLVGFQEKFVPSPTMKGCFESSWVGRTAHEIAGTKMPDVREKVVSWLGRF